MRIVLFISSAFLTFFCSAQTTDFAIKKFSPSIVKFKETNIKADSVDVVLSFNNARSFNEWRKKTHVISGYSPSNVSVVRLRATDLQQLLADSSIVFADMLRKPKEELTTGSLDISLNKLNVVHSRYPTINGNSINVSLKEQQYDIDDVDWKGRSFNSGVGATTRSSHASIMATMVGGGGNSSPFAMGAAPGVNMTSSDFAGLLPDADSVYRHFNITVQNHSYGTGIENYYGSDAAAFDASTYINSTLIHIFSSGNSGTATTVEGRYKGIPQVANLTGSFKMAKNIITVGATDSFNNVMSASSKGPAYDGRVKPELVAFGLDGTSGATALVSGAAALIQHAHLRKFGTLPFAALTKALLLNSADDVDAKQVDFTSGYGSLNAYKAVKAVEENHFFIGDVMKGQTKSFEIQVPANIANLKVMLVWTDVPAEANATKALVNDLDCRLSFPITGEKWSPWVLNTVTISDSLNQPAIRKTDTLNTVEQITIEQPKAGTYSFEVKADKINSGSQQFAVVYQFDTLRNFSWTYPTAANVLEASSTNVLRWQSNIPENGKLEISINNGKWQSISTINTKDNYTKWITPDTVCTARLKMFISSSNIEKVSEEFVISRPIDVQVGFNCTDSFMLHWNHFPHDQYEIYTLEEKYLQPIVNTSDTFNILSKKKHASLYFAVAPKVGSLHGRRSYIIDYTSQGVECYFQTFYASLINKNSALLEARLGSLYGVQKVLFQKQNRKGVFENIHSAASPLNNAFSYTDAAPSKGVNNYRIGLTLANGITIYSPAEHIYYFPKEPVIAFPNPVRQGQPFKLIAQEPGVYTIVMYDATGKLYYKGLLEDINKEVPTTSLGKGMYLIRISSKEGGGSTQKILVN